MKIHPTAIVSPAARIGPDVEIGPHVIIGDGAEIGAGCVIQGNAVIEGCVTLGTGNVVGYGAVLGAAPQDFAHTLEIKSAVVIGNNNRLREYVTIHRGTKEGTTTRLGDGCFLMVGCHVGHNSEVGNEVILTNNVLLAGYVQVGDGAVLGGGSVFHQFLRIGRRAMVAGGARFNKDIPPFVLAEDCNHLHGVNVVGLRRAGMSAECRSEIRRAFRRVYFSTLPLRAAVQEALESPWGPEASEFLEFILSSKRGCSTLFGGRGGSSKAEE